MDNKIFRNIVEDSPCPIIITSGDAYAWLNPSACNLFGIDSPEGLAGTPVMETIHPDYHGIVKEMFGRLKEDKAPGEEIYEFKIIRPGGSEVWVEAMARPFSPNEKSGGLFMMYDISLRKEKEKAILMDEAKFRDVFQKHIAVKLIFDPDTGDIVEANDAAARFYGWSVEELKKMNISRINTLPFPEIMKEIERAKGSVSTHFKWKHRTAGGGIKEVEVYGSRVGSSGGKDYVHSIVHDVTLKNTNERRLKLLSRSVDQSPVSVMITDTRGGIEYVNPRFEEISGYSFREIKGKNPRFLKSGYQTREFYRELWTTILDGKDWTGEFLNKKKNGELYWIQAVISPIIDDRGKVTNFVSIREDITERKRMMEELVAARDKAEESDKLKLAFLANMSHEIRTPMNGILGFAEMLKTPGLSAEEQQKFIEIIEESGNRMLETVNDLIDISKIETGQVNLQITETDLNGQIDSLIEFFMPQAEKKSLHLVLKERLPDRLATMKTDRVKLDSILTNLLKNAIKFTHEGKIEVGCVPGKGFVEYYVSDTGIGVAADRQEAIFNRFEQADMKDSRSFQGAGLGLSIARSYAEMLGGEIRMESEEGRGSTFYFNLPLKEAETVPEPEPVVKLQFAKTDGIPRLQGRKILIVEDDLFSREMIVYQLNTTGAALVTAEDGSEAIEKLGNHNFDLVLLDIRMPKIDGFGVLKHIRETCPGLLVIAQSAYAMADDISRFKEAGFNDYLTKPISQENLHEKLNKYFA